MIKQLFSINNPTIKNLVKFNTKKAIKEFNMCIVEGEKLVAEMLTRNRVDSLYITSEKIKDFSTKYSGLTNNIKTYEISQAVANKISDTVSASGICALVYTNKSKELDFSKKFVVLNELQNPSNVGAIIRSAMAFGFNQIVLIDSVEVFMPKVIRASMGYVFDMDIVILPKSVFIDKIRSNNIVLLSAQMDGTPLNSIKEKHIGQNYGFVFGNEGYGIDKDIEKICKYSISIPMLNNVESLNVGVSAGIIMYHLNNCD